MKKITNLFRILIFLAFLGSGSAQAIMLSLVPSTQDVDLGNMLSVELTVSGLGDGSAPSLGAYDMDITYDSSLLAFDTATFGTGLDVLGLGSIMGIDSSVTGVVNLFEVSLDWASDLEILQPPAFTLATLTFDTLATGSSALGLSDIILGDAWGDPLAAEVTGGSVTVTQPGAAVPEPGSLGLMAFGIACLIFIRRNRMSE